MGDYKGQKIVFLDIDGTLIPFHEEIMPDSTVSALRQAQENGHLMVICTGRSRHHLPEFIAEFGFDGIIGAAGAFGIYEGKEIFHHYFPRTAREKLIRYMEENRFVYSVQTDLGEMYNARCLKEMKRALEERNASETFKETLFRNKTVREDIWNYPRVEKAFYQEAPFSLKEVQEALLPEFSVTDMSIYDGGGNAGEICLFTVNKAAGMREFIEYAGISHENTIAIGDGPNDFEMIEYAEIGIAMGNALPALKEQADFVTEPVDEDGIYAAFKRFGLI